MPLAEEPAYQHLADESRTARDERLCHETLLGRKPISSLAWARRCRGVKQSGTPSHSLEKAHSSTVCDRFHAWLLFGRWSASSRSRTPDRSREPHCCCIRRSPRSLISSPRWNARRERRCFAVNPVASSSLPRG